MNTISTLKRLGAQVTEKADISVAAEAFKTGDNKSMFYEITCESLLKNPIEQNPD